MSQQWFKKITKNQLFWSFELSFSLVFLCVFIYLASNLETIINYDVITTLSIVVSSVVSFATTIAILLNRQNEQNGSHNKLWPLVSTVVASAYAFVAGIFGYFVSIIFSMAFRQMTFDILSASVLLATLGGLISYYLYEHVSKFDRSNFARLIFVQYIGGFFLAAMKTGDPDWWSESICSLGMAINGAPFYFNFTMVLTGVLLWCFYYYLKPTFEKLQLGSYLNKKQLLLVKIFYFSAGAMAVILGLLPYGISETINFVHNLFGYGIYEFFAIFMVFAGFVLRKFPKKFLAVNYLFLFSGSAIFIGHTVFGISTHGIMELLLALILVGWLVAFIKTITSITSEY